MVAQETKFSDSACIHRSIYIGHAFDATLRTVWSNWDW